VAVAQQCGQALERARLYEDERKAREQAERARGRMEYLAQASAILASSLDYQTTLTNVTRLATPSIADWCAVDLLNEEGKIERLAVAHVDPAKVEWAWELYRKSPPDMNAPRGLGKVIRTGESDFYPDIPDEVLVAAARDEENLKLLRDIGFRSAMTVPIQTHGRIFGALTLVNTKDSDRYFNEDDLALAEDLARRAATAIDNARLYEEAQAQREYWRVTLSSVGDAVIVTDETGKLTFLNDVASILTGWTLADALGKPLTEVFNIVNEHTRELVESPVEKVLREGVVVGLANHTVLISRDGHEVPIDDSGAPMRDEQGNLIGVVLVFRDITERKQIEMEREQVLEQERHARQEAERADQLKLKFLGMVSHELRTPLASIKGFASSLLAQDVNWEKDTERNFLSIIDSEADKLTGLVDQLLDLSRLQAGTMKIEAAPNSIYEIFETTMPQLQTLSQRHHLDIVLAPDLPRVMADPQRIGQVLSNLVSNAAKYAPQETPISINVKRIPDGIQVDVADQGPGIPEYAREYVFEAFRQVEERGRGAGLGLAICKAMVEGHGGRIWIDESYTDGAKISFTLPLAQ
jgi:PAS domain S-box-containing protein